MALDNETHERLLTPRLGAFQEWCWNHRLRALGNAVSTARYHSWRLANRPNRDELDELRGMAAGTAWRQRDEQ